jgi:hypothetical protein
MNGDGWRIGVDIGGTFADCVGIAPDGTRRRIKILTDGRVRTLATRVGDSTSTGTAHPQYALTALPPWAAPALVGMTAVAAVTVTLFLVLPLLMAALERVQRAPATA